jgi:iron complex outermembrane receptor protein
MTSSPLDPGIVDVASRADGRSYTVRYAMGSGGSATFNDALRTQRFDGGAVGRFVLGKRLLTVRGSAMSVHYRREFGTVIERDRQQAFFGEAALSGTNGTHTWTAGSAFQTDRYRNRDVPRFDYTFITPALFAQDEYSPTPHVTLSASGRLDFNNRYGTFFSPRVSALIRLPGAMTARPRGWQRWRLPPSQPAF